MTTVSGAASPWRRAAILGVSPKASCSCRPPPPISPTTTSPVWIPRRTARWTPCSCTRRVLSVLHGLDHPKPGPHGALRIIFVRLGIAEVDEQAIAEILRNMAVKALDHLGTGVLIGAHDLAQVFGIELAGERGRVHQVTEQHGELTAFGLGAGWSAEGRILCPAGRRKGRRRRGRRRRRQGVSRPCPQSRPGRAPHHPPQGLALEEFVFQRLQVRVIERERTWRVR